MASRSVHIGFVGLGQMGRPIAHNLAKSGASLTVCNRSDTHFGEFARDGITATSDYRSLRSADIILLCLPNADIAREVLFGADGIDPGQRQGQIIVDLSTATYDATLAIGEELKQRGVAFLDAPISGMEARARDGTLTVMCGGERGAFETVKPYFDLIGNKILYMGPAGSGQLTKLINQLLFDINAAALAEILPMATKMGLDPELVGEVVNSGTGRSYASDFFISRVLQDRFSDGYGMSKAYKDLVSGAEISAKLCIPMPVLAAATATYQMALLKGHGDKDKGGMIRVFEDLLGVQYRKAVNGAAHGVAP